MTDGELANLTAEYGKRPPGDIVSAFARTMQRLLVIAASLNEEERARVLRDYVAPHLQQSKEGDR